jgi:hypothetical protein
MFSFQTDEISQDYCEKIIQAMELLYDIDPATGLDIVNAHWHGSDLREDAPFAYLFYHLTIRQWANRLGNPNTPTDNSAWRARGEEAERRIAVFRRAGKFEWLRDDFRIPRNESAP